VLHDNKLNHFSQFHSASRPPANLHLTGTGQCQDRCTALSPWARTTDLSIRHFHANRFVTLTINFPAVHWGAVPPYRPVLDSSSHNMPNYQFLYMLSFCQGDLFWHHFHLYVVCLGLFLLLGDTCDPPSIRCILSSHLHCLPFYFTQYKRIKIVSYGVVSHLTMQGTVVTPLRSSITANDTLPQSRVGTVMTL